MQRKDLPSPLRLGLVLSGGGAKGAYEEGVMQALARERGCTAEGRGLRLRTGDGWVHLTPLVRRSSLRVAAEGPDLELAAELCDFYAELAARLDREAAEKEKK